MLRHLLSPPPTSLPLHRVTARAISGGVGLLLALPVLPSCGDGSADGPRAGSQAGAANDEDSAPRESEASPPLAVAVDGYENENGAGAHVVVREDIPPWLEIGAGLSGGGYVQLKVALGAVKGIVGEHTEPFGLPDESETNATASLDGLAYYSQGGEITLDLTAEGHAEGHFELELATLSESAPGQTPIYAASEAPRTLSGSFTGSWSLSCYSRIIAHQTWIPGGEYCGTLELE